ncbi:DUF6318 family protein [Brachybacterium alimentarium]|uniref:DUF6318 family protein n=1 Tax=Brachybacterium alimentarium TaxID=47845 RepID=UPI000DF2A48D|nr:DUF6318 family protein [Brachybacterium alimentarium]RCS69407.1 hypothetical protein CIK73_05630 [Brachybacterium alimentarium]RCS71381.1 hypothetical protein CIK68_10400 [Brachybacterium alimentarium]RCS82778.1 hypothetical protein CIK72_03120 [Brachybacterium alimentarium]
MSRRLLAAVAAAALTCGISACTEGQESARTDPPADVVADAPSDGGGESPVSDGGGDAEGADAADGSTSAAADLPAPDPADFPGMDENTEDGSEQAFRYYWATILWGLSSGSVSPSGELQTKNCEECVLWSHKITAQRDAGQYWSEVEVDDQILEGDLDESQVSVVNYLFLVPAHEEPVQQGSDRENVSERVYSAAGKMVWVDGRWKVDEMALETANHGEG